MADAVAVRTQVLSAAQFMAQEVFAPYRALFQWLPSTVTALFLTDAVGVTETGVNMTAAADTNLLAVEASQSGATTGVFIQAFSVAGATLGTTVPIVAFRCPLNDRVVIPCFGFQNGQFGFRSVTRLSVYATTIASLSAAPTIAADRPTVRTIAFAA